MSRLGTVGLCALASALFSAVSKADEAADAKAHAASIAAAARQPIEVATANEAQGLTKIKWALDEETAFDFTELPLTDAVKYLTDKHTIEIQIDTKMLEAESIGIDTPVTRSLRGITLRSGLRLMLDPLELTYLVKDEVLLITTAKAASIERTVRIYPVGDLIAADSTDKPGQGLVPLVEIIEGTVEPKSWRHPGGADIEPFALGHALVIRQTWAGHEQIDLLLTGLRRARSVESQRAANMAIVDLLEPPRREQKVQRADSE
jgi:hypothetical protein